MISGTHCVPNLARHIPRILKHIYGRPLLMFSMDFPFPRAGLSISELSSNPSLSFGRSSGLSVVLEDYLWIVLLFGSFVMPPRHLSSALFRHLTIASSNRGVTKHGRR